MEPQIKNSSMGQQRQDPYQMMGPDSSSAPGWSWRLFSFSLFLLIVSAVFYIGIEFGYSSFLRSQITKVDASLDQIEQEVSSSDQESFINFYSQVLHIEEILSNHTFFSPFFTVLENNIQSGVIITSLEYQAQENRIALEGIADSFKDLGEQLQRIDSLESIDRALISESRAASGGGVFFRINLYPNKTVFEDQESAVINPVVVEEDQALVEGEEDIQVIE